MRKLLTLLCSAFAFNAVATSSYASEEALPHFDLELSAQEYRYFLSQMPLENTVAEDVEKAIKVGTRNLDWIAKVNMSRSVDMALKLTSPQTQTGIPIDKPKIYSDVTVSKDLKDFQAKVPAEIGAVLFAEDALPTTIPTDDETFLTWARQINKIYETGARWKLMVPYLNALALRKRNDVRGYFHLTRETDLALQLKQFSAQPAEKRALLRTWLLGICLNSTGIETICKVTLDAKISNNEDLNPYYSKYVSGGKKSWDAFFQIAKLRSDVKWTSANPNLATVPFKNPNDNEVKAFLGDNIADEWKWNGWQLVLAFTNSPSSKTPYVEFVPGITANAELAGARIQLDGNVPITEYAQQWTIRHEFGHTLGFPDCYVEFYDSSEEVIVNYQLDVDNLMCSRKGHLNQVLFDEMKAAYYK